MHHKTWCPEACFRQTADIRLVLHFHFSVVVQAAMFFVTYFALVLTFAGILVAMESQTGGRCGLKGYKIYSSASSFYEAAYELSWSTVSSRSFDLCLVLWQLFDRSAGQTQSHVLFSFKCLQFTTVGYGNVAPSGEAY